MSRDVDNLMWETRPCPGCSAPVTVPRELEPTRLCLPCQSWQRVERSRLKAGLAPAVENNLGQDAQRDELARQILDLLDAPSAIEQTYAEPKPEVGAD